MYEQGFSEYEVKDTSVKFLNDTTQTAATRIGCVGSLEETMNSKTITKKCEGVVVKTVTRGDGTGELALSLHMRYDLFLKSYGMVSDGLKEGVYSYGQSSKHNPFCLTCRVLDEDGVEKLKAYPNCVITTGIARKIENGAEEVAEMELTVSVMPDDNGQGLYEAISEEITDDTIITQWLNNFTLELVTATTEA